MNSLQVLSVIAASQGVLISGVLLSRRRHRAANGWLAAYIAVQSATVLAMFTMSSVTQPPIIATAYTIGSTYLTGPLLYFYAQATTGGRLPPRRLQLLLHLLPGLLVLAFVYWQKAAMSDAVRELGWITNFSADDRPMRGYAPLIDTPLLGVVGVTISAGYMLGGLRLFTPFGLRLREVFSAGDRMELRWAQLFIATAMFCALSAAAPMALRMVGAADWLPVMHFHLYVPRLTLLWLVGVVMFMTIRQSPLFAADIGAAAGPRPEAQPQASQQPQPPKYRTSSLSAEVSEAHWSRLTALMAAEQLHRINGLTLAQLAERLGISADHLTQVINTHSGSNFFDFVNGYRIEEAKRLLADPANRQPLKTIVYAVGFNSQSAFYKQFARHTGVAPAAFRRAHGAEGFTTAQSH